MTDQKERHELGWCILELMGHRRLGGHCTEVELAGHAFIRIDVPDDFDREGRTAATQFYSGGAVYCITPTTEDVARQVAVMGKPEPVHRWELPPAPRDEDSDVVAVEDFDGDPGSVIDIGLDKDV